MRHRCLPGFLVVVCLLPLASLRANENNGSEPSSPLSAGWYAAAGIGWNFAGNVTSEGAIRRLEFDLGLPALTFTLGRFLGNGWRAELDASYRGNDPEILYLQDSDTSIQPDGSDTLHTLSGQISLLREFRQHAALRPYLGAGLGLSRLNMTLGNGRTRRFDVLLNDSDWSLSWQLIAGFSLPLGAQWDFAADYRYWEAPTASFRDVDGNALSFRHRIHSGTLHLRYLFTPRAERIAAAPSPGAAWYAAANLGLNHAVDAEIEASLENFDAFRVGSVATLAVGYRSSRHWRWELEAARRRNDVEIVDFGLIAGQFEAGGRVIADSVMVNGLYRFRPGRAVRPVLGLGLGVAFADYEVSVLEGPEAGPYVDDTTTGPAFQAIVGIDYLLTKQVTLTADLRSWISWDLNMTRPGGDGLSTWHWTNSMSLGLRIAL